MPTDVTVVIPVGPYAANKRWLEDCLESVRAQTYPAAEVLLIDDMAGLNPGPLGGGVSVWRAPWRLGIATAFNMGVSLARHECVFLLGSDDWLEPACLEECVKAYESSKHPDETYFFVGVRYSDGREDQFLPCNAAMVSKSLWRHTGGFPIEAASGAPDAALISIMLHKPEAGRAVGVCQDRPLYNYRVHDETDTAQRAKWQGVILATRGLLTQSWSQPVWGRYEE